MMRRILLILGVGLLALLEAAVLAALDSPVALVHFSLIAVANLVTAFRTNDAWIAALLAGIVLDLTMPWPTGCGTFSMLLCVALLVPLATRILTHVSLPSLLGLNAFAFILFHLACGAFRSASDLIAGHGFRLWPEAGFWPFAVAFLIQLVAVAFWQVVARRAHRRLMSSFLILR